MSIWYVGVEEADLEDYTFEEIDGSPVEDWRSDGFRATRTLKCLWADRIELTKALLGGAEVTGQDYILHRAHRYPHNTFAYVTSVSVSPFGGVNASQLSKNEIRSTYIDAFLTVTYETTQSSPSIGLGDSGVPYDQSNPVYVTEAFDGAAEFLTLPTKDLYWDDQGIEPIDPMSAPAKLVRLQTWTITFHQVMFVPSFIFDWVGKVNLSKHASPALGSVKTFNKETLLWNAPTLRREFSAYGYSPWEISLSISHKPDGWNKFYKSGNAAPQPLWTKAGVTEPPPLAEYKPFEVVEMGGTGGFLPAG